MDGGFLKPNLLLNHLTKTEKALNEVKDVLNKNELAKLIKKVPKRIVIVIDAAYAEYMTDNEYTAGINFAKKNKKSHIILDSTLDNSELEKKILDIVLKKIRK